MHARDALTLACTLVALLTGCRDFEDCKLYSTCSKDLLGFAEKMAGDGATACLDCLDRRCPSETLACSTDSECNFTSRCMLTTSPTSYQECLGVLREAGYTHGDEQRDPWEGTRKTFGTCLHDQCKDECAAERFSCTEHYSEYGADMRIIAAVRLFPSYKPAAGISVQFCDDSCAKECCSQPADTDEKGIVTFPAAASRLSAKERRLDRDSGVGAEPFLSEKQLSFIAVEDLYFKLRPQAGHEREFPITLYYPGRLGRSDTAPDRSQRAPPPQLLAVYVIPNDLIAAGNETLGRARTILSDRAQSVILPDSCIWEENSAPDLRVSVQGVPQCHTLERACTGDDCTPCVWYAEGRSPKWSATRTDGHGAGVVGLETGKYTIRVVREVEGKAELIARRTIRMQAGALTIARTWPLPLPMRETFSEPP